MGICYFLIKNKNIKKKIKLISIIYITLFILLLLICVLPPLTSFDGRSIWFFHSKIIYYESCNFSRRIGYKNIRRNSQQTKTFNSIGKETYNLAYHENLLFLWIEKIYR